MVRESAMVNETAIVNMQNNKIKQNHNSMVIRTAITISDLQ